MEARQAAERAVNVFDHVTVEGRPGVAIGFYARKERIVVVRLDVDGVVEVPESEVVVVTEREEVGWPKSISGRAGRWNGEPLGRLRIAG
jgi:ethanolamine utilization protein EutQ (cupin superfamily)